MTAYFLKLADRSFLQALLPAAPGTELATVRTIHPSQREQEPDIGGEDRVFLKLADRSFFQALLSAAPGTELAMARTIRPSRNCG